LILCCVGNADAKTDYSDTHKQKGWQAYAAITAAAYANSLLSRITPFELKKEKNFGESSNSQSCMKLV
jgi:hypothetical protein